MRSFFLCAWCFLLLLSCERDEQETEVFSNTPPEQLFTIEAERDTILFGEAGTRLFVPANSFIYPDGSIVSGEIEISLIEATSLADQLLMDAAGENQLGVIKMEAKQDAEQLVVNPQNQLFLQLPAQGLDGDYSLQTGKVRRNGKIRWQKGKPAQSFLVPLDFSELAYHPGEFRAELMDLLPFGKFKDYSIELADSLYFSFAGGEMLELIEGFRYTRMNEPYYNRHYVFRNGQYTDESFDLSDHDRSSNREDASNWPIMAASCGIDPAKVQALKSPDFAGSLLSTSAFAERLAEILSVGDDELLDIYINNLEQDLWETDQQAATYLAAKGSPRSEQFRKFSLQGLTNTKDGAIYGDLLRKTLADRMARFERQINQKRQEIRTALRAKNEEVDQLKEEYRQILWKREQHRMRYLSFELDELGWYWPNRRVANPTDTVFMAELVATVPDASQYDELYLYNVMPYAKSIFRLNTTNGTMYYPGAADEKRMYQKLHQAAKIVAVGYKKGKLFIGEADYQVEYENKVEVSLKPSTRQRFNTLMAADVERLYENRISIDLPYVRALQTERVRQTQLWEEQYALYFLGAKAYPNCNPEPSLAEAEVLFATHCANCHAQDLKTDLTGPALINGPTAYTKMWFTRFTENSQNMIALGDPRALKQWHEWGPTVMNSFAGQLTKAEISAIYKYIQSAN